jgi:phenylpyruvate tautomerase PptA (4-oxalocrotonate tautomerase family)
MPLVSIDILAGKDQAYKKALLDGVHAALVKALKIPQDDRNQRLHELAPENYERRPGRTDKFTLVEITLFKGRSMDAKRALYKAIVTNLGREPGIDGNDIMIVLHEVPLENWGIRGGKPASEVDLGFKVDV